MISIRRAFLYSLLVPLLLTFYLFSRNEYRLASVWQPMSNHSMYSVHIWVRYAAEHGSLVIPSFYPPHVQELLRHSPVSPDEFYRDRRYILRKKYPGSTRLTTLKQALEAETRIPLSIQSHFGQARYETTDEKWGEGLERETVTVYDAWAVQEDKDELPEGEVHISLVTTAWRLQEIFGVNTSQDPLVGRVLVWRHHVAILRYLRNKYDNSPGGQTRQNVEEKINEYKRLERASSKEVLSMFWDLDRLIGGVVEKKTRNKDNQSMETREREIETRLEQFWKEKKDIMERVSSMRNKAGGKKDSGVGPQSATYDQSQSHLEQTTAEKPKTMESRLDFDFTPAKEKIVTKPLRTDSGQLRLDSDGFRLRSGILLWGQLHTVFAGSMNRDFQRNAEAAPSMLPGGTITQFILKYRAAARNGKWKVRKAFGIPYPGNEGAPTEHFGWVVFHEDVDPVEVLNRCSRITGYGGISNGNTHIDKDVLYVGRYDWSNHCDPGKTDETFYPLYRDFIRDSIGARLVDKEGLDEYDIEAVEHMGLSTRRQGFMLAVDADHFSPDFMKSFIQECPRRANHGEAERIFRQAENGDDFGAFVSVSETEYELAWLLFSGNKHETFREADELVAIVYDGRYKGLQSHAFAVENDPVQSPST